MLKKSLVAFLLVCAFGLVRWPMEKAFTAQVQEQGLVAPPLDATTREQLGQTGAAVVLGGLRSMIASMLNLRAHVAFTDQRWFDLEETYKITTTLQPRNHYYWDSGSWHLAYNASSDYKTRKSIPPAIRRIKEREYIEKGIAFLEKGIRMNTEGIYLKKRMASILTDRFKVETQDFPRAADYLKEVMESPSARDLDRRTYLYAIARIPDRAREAYELARKLFESDRKNRVSTLACLIFAYQEKLSIPQAERMSLSDLFGDEASAFKHLETYHQRRAEGLPQSGVRAAVQSLGRRYGENATQPDLTPPASIAR